MLATDYKILAKALATRLQKVISDLVNNDHVGYTKGRYIGENVRIIEDIMFYTSNNNVSGFIVLIDYEKAFDMVEWDFLFKTLNAYNFGETFINGSDYYITTFLHVTSCHVIFNLVEELDRAAPFLPYFSYLLQKFCL